MSISELFMKSNGQPIFYNGKELIMIDNINISNEATVKIKFLATDSKWIQGISLDTKGTFKANKSSTKNTTVLWEDTAPQTADIVIKSSNGILQVYNIWKKEDGSIDYWSNGAAMCVEQQGSKRIYHCNDGYPDDDLNDLIFSLEILG